MLVSCLLYYLINVRSLFEFCIKKFYEEKINYNKEEINYSKARFKYFSTEYDRENPVTKNKAILNFLLEA